MKGLVSYCVKILGVRLVDLNQLTIFRFLPLTLLWPCLKQNSASHDVC